MKSNRMRLPYIINKNKNFTKVHIYSYVIMYTTNIYTYIYKQLHLHKKQFSLPGWLAEVIHVFTIYMWQHVFGTFIGLQVYTPSRSSESSSLPFNQGHSADILQLYLKVSHRDFINLISLSFAKQASHHTTECLGMEVQELEMHYSLLLCTSLGYSKC